MPQSPGLSAVMAAAPTASVMLVVVLGGSMPMRSATAPTAQATKGDQTRRAVHTAIARIRSCSSRVSVRDELRDNHHGRPRASVDPEGCLHRSEPLKCAGQGTIVIASGRSYVNSRSPFAPPGALCAARRRRQGPHGRGAVGPGGPLRDPVAWSPGALTRQAERRRGERSSRRVDRCGEAGVGAGALL